MLINIFKNKNPQRKKIFLLLILLFLLAVPIVLYLLLKDDSSDEWYSSDWNFRRSIVLENGTGESFVKEEVLIEIDTEKLIEDNKMQWDCDDLRFLDSDNKTNLDYWIEGGCNTESTQIWVEIPSLPEDGKVIYAYYGNETAPNSEIQWEGNFLMFSDSIECSDGWSKNSIYDDKFLYGNDISGEEIGNNQHNHGGSIVLDNTHITISDCEEGCTANMDIDQKDDNYILNISTEDNVPPYTTLLVCQSNNLSFTNQIAYFDSTESLDNWIYLSDMEDTFIRGSSLPNLKGGRNDHTHEIISIYSLPQETSEYSNYIGSLEKKDSTTFGLVGIYTESASNYPAYQILALEKNSTKIGHGENNMILPVTELPPLGWEYYEELEERFPLVGKDIGETGGSNTHKHNIESLLTISNLEENNGEESIDLKTGNLILETVSNIPESITIVYAKRKESIQTAIKDEEILITEEKNSLITGNNIIAQTDDTQEEGDVKGASTPLASDLLTEGEINPIKVIDTTPEFSAIFTDPDTGDTGEYYQIQISPWSSFSSIFWDSGKISMTSTPSGSRCPDISYSGQDLATYYQTPISTFYWRIKFWDSDGTEGSWSTETSYFKISSGPQAYSLQTNGEDSPTFLNSSIPTFTFRCLDINGDSCTAYQIKVNSSYYFNGTEYWDSGKISISIPLYGQSEEIQYNGIPLTNSDNTLYWKAFVWDTDDLTSTPLYSSFFIDSFPVSNFYLEGLDLEGIQIN